jgi:hypothetical protein
MATAVEAWDEQWATPEGRAGWLVPHPALASTQVVEFRVTPQCRSAA